MLGFILLVVIGGLIAGFIARAVVPGNDHMSLLQTLLLGVVGSFVGGFLGYVLFGKDLNEGAVQPSGIVGAIIGAIIALVVYNKVTGRKSVGHRRAHV